MKYSFLFIAVIFAFTTSCSDQKIDTTQARKEMEAREIKVVSDAQIIQETMRLGQSLIKTFSIESVQNEKGLNYDVKYGNDTLWNKTHYLFEKDYALEGKLFEVFDAYQYNWEEGIASEPNVQKLAGGTELLFTAPMNHDGKTIGMWAITFSRKQIVLGIEL